MNNHKAVKNWHKKILDENEQRIGRPLSAEEAKFITSRVGFIALEVIDDTVMSATDPKQPDGKTIDLLRVAQRRRWHS